MRHQSSSGRLVAAALLLLLALPMRALAQDPPRFEERVDVTRMLLDVRVIDARGKPILGLQPADFEVRIGGRRARVESVQHVSGGGQLPGETIGASPAAATAARSPSTEAAPGRLVVFLFQKSLDRSRIPGTMLMLRELQRTLGTFPPDDHVAVLRFDSRLHLLHDFSRDRDALRRAFEHDVLFGRATAALSEAPSLRPALDRERVSPSYSMENALMRIAEALEPLPGPKSVVVIGYGFGRLGPAGVAMEAGYDDAREALQRARASVFCLDVTDADYHSLEAGLQLVADDTGGLYQRTHIFSRAALDRVVAALDGQYVLFVEKPQLRPGSHRLDVRLKGRDGVVLGQATYVQ